VTADGTQPGGAAPRDLVRGELSGFVREHEQRRRQIPRAIVLGLLAGLAATAFRAALAGAERLRLATVEAAHGFGWIGVLVPTALGAVGAAIAVALVRARAPEAAGSGIPQLKAALYGMRPLRAAPILGVKFAGGVAGIGTGLALGREGPTIQMGSAIGQMVSRWFACTPRERRTLIAAGAGAGLAAAFNAPVAGLIFVLEEVERRFAPALFAITLVASVVADVVARVLYGQLPVFHVTAVAPPPLAVLPMVVVLGGVAGVLGVAFNAALLAALDLARRVRWPPVATAATVGAFAGLLGWFWPELPGTGQHLLDDALAGHVAPAALLGCFVARFGLTMASYATGAPGGIFAPLLVLGAEIGVGAAMLANAAVPSTTDYGTTFAVVGMAAYFSAVVRAPLTGIVLMVEMTGGYALVLPLLVASLIAYGLADFLRSPPIYEALLERDLARDEPAATLERTLLVEVTINAGAPWEGRRVDQLGLPAGCVLVAVRRDGRDEVPTASFVMRSGDEVTAVVAPQAAAAVLLLHRGAGSLLAHG
jgi:CIC family chloride channel protein